jgi:hypothetical protein
MRVCIFGESDEFVSFLKSPFVLTGAWNAWTRVSLSLSGHESVGGKKLVRGGQQS